MSESTVPQTTTTHPSHAPTQTDKFKARKDKKAYIKYNAKPLLTLGEMTDLNFKQTAKKPRKPIKAISDVRLSRLMANINPIEINDKAEFEAAYQSIQSVINRMHPDIKKLFHRGIVHKYVATADHLTIHLDTGISIQVTPLHDKKNKYLITQRLSSHKKQVLYENIG